MDSLQARQYIAHLDAVAEHRSAPFLPGRTMRWRTFGKGEPLVLIHGGYGSWLHWIRNIEALAKHHWLLIPDLPGYGESHDPPEGAVFQTIVDAVIASLDSLLGGRRAIDLAGFSFGGAVSARIAVQRGAVRRLAFLGSASSGTPRRPRAPLVSWRKSESTAQEAMLFRQNLLAHMLYDEANLDGLAFEAYIAPVKATRFRSRNIPRGGPLTEVLEHFAEPVLFVWGEHDVTSTPQLVKEPLTRVRPNRE
ncbi:MAG TPA: alpha/beta fold hydrolase, partial [Burkholderiales bacterium]|nr:alpha/beta fold hydrolase [Burkholderiales bacterium]